jgi:hypothetical protein
MNKKGALELSITAIVVLIIAITVLGLGIGFIKNLFSEGTETISAQFDSVKEQLREEFIQRGDVVGFDKGKNIEVDLGSREEFFLGIRNTDSGNRCFKADVICLQSFSGEGCGSVGKDSSLVGEWFTSFPPEGMIEGNEFYLAPVKFYVANVGKETYRVSLNLYKGDEGADCGSLDTSGDPDESKLIHITVK